MARRAWNKLNNTIYLLESAPLWSLGFVLIAIVFAPILALGKGCVFPVHDQLDETILSYVFTAKYLGTGTDVYPEMMGGIQASGLQPSAVLFVPLYRIFSTYTAFLIQYAIVLAAAFFGMYACAKELTGNSILALVSAGFFAMLPSAPVYGLSVAGVPLAIWCFLQCCKMPWKISKEAMLTFLLLTFFGLTTHLVLIGYVVLGVWLLALIVRAMRKSSNRMPVLGFLWLLMIYIVVNWKLIFELIFGESSYISHREELVNDATALGKTAWDVFLNSGQHAESFHKYLILPIFAMLFLGILFWKKLSSSEKRTLATALVGMGVLIAIALFYAFCKSQPVVEFKNRCYGFLHYFQMERFYWVYPAGWYIEFALCAAVLWKHLKQPLLRILLLALVLVPTYGLVKENSYLYLNVNQYNNGSSVTGYVSWESYYAEDLMQALDEVIGRDKETYRIAHVGMSPAPALMHGFFTVDGYSNNYSLEYKHAFRKVIAAEIIKVPETAAYFDTWGSRCYLFNAASGNAWMLGKNSGVTYEKLEFDMDALKGLGCEYIFSSGEIGNAKELGMECMGYFETESSYWGVWLYRVK